MREKADASVLARSASKFEAMVADLKARGLLDKRGAITPAGHDWCGALMERLDSASAAEGEKLLKEWQARQEAAEAEVDEWRNNWKAATSSSRWR